MPRHVVVIALALFVLIAGLAAIIVFVWLPHFRIDRRRYDVDAVEELDVNILDAFRQRQDQAEVDASTPPDARRSLPQSLPDVDDHRRPD